MIRSTLQKLAKLGRRRIGTQPCPEIRWPDVTRIEALGTDTFGAFEVWLTFRHADGSEVTLFTHHRGYDRILESLPQRYPSIPPTWYQEMSEQPWHVERVLYDNDVA